MENRYYIIFGLFLFTNIIISQNKQILFGFEEIPQNLMINPSAEINQKYYVSVPLLSNIYLKAGLTGFSASNLLSNDGVNINTKLNSLLNNVNNTDYYTLNQQFEVFSFGYQLNNTKKDFLSFGFYEEFDGIVYHPKDLITLTYGGNQDFSKRFNLRDLSFKAELLGIYHVGISRKVNDKIRIGLRAKIYSSVANITSRINTGQFSTRLGEDNIYQHQLSNIDLTIKTSGIIDSEGEVVAGDKVVNRFLASGNMGLGLDFGIDYKVNDKVKIKASFTDLGFVRHKKNTTIYSTKGNYNFEGINLLFPTDGNTENYWSNFASDVEDNLPLDTLNVKYTTMRSLKVNSSMSYTFGKNKKNNCLRSENRNSYANEIGVELFSVFRPKQPQFAATLFYYRRLSKYLQTKITYTVDDFSYTNVGAGFSSQISRFNLYLLADNLVGYSNLAKSKSQSIQLGMNLIFN